MFDSRGFNRPWRIPRLEPPVMRGARPRTLWIGGSALLVAAAVNLAIYLSGVFSLVAEGFDDSTTVVLLVALSLAAIFLVLLPLWTGIAVLRGSALGALWAFLYFVAQFAVAFQSLDPLLYGMAAVALAASILLWLPASRAYARGTSSTRGDRNRRDSSLT